MAIERIKPYKTDEDTASRSAAPNPYRTKISSGSNPLWICEKHRCQHEDLCVHRPRGRELPSYLARLKTDATAMSKIRHLVYRSEAGHRPHLLSDHQVIEQFFRLLQLDRWRICSPQCTGLGAKHTVWGKEQASPPPPQTPPTPRASRSAPPPPVSDTPETTFPPNHDAIAQAAALTEAAQEGQPFCEECEKLRQQQDKAS